MAKISALADGICEGSTVFDVSVSPALSAASPAPPPETVVTPADELLPGCELHAAQDQAQRQNHTFSFHLFSRSFPVSSISESFAIAGRVLRQSHR